MKRIFILICFIFFTGCKAEYNVFFENNQIKESLNITSLANDENFKNSIDDFYSNSIFLVDYNIDTGDMSNSEIISKYSIYNKSIIKNDNLYGLELGYDYDLDREYKDSSIVHSLFNNFTITNTYLKAYEIKNIFSYYPNLDEISITFKSDKVIEDSNADKEEDGIYYWNINKDNYKDKSVIVKYSLENNYINNLINSKNRNNFLYIILGVMGIVILISTVVIYEKVKNSNK